jgi:pimeloyl-ACP methyl ester carboxylesterase
LSQPIESDRPVLLLSGELDPVTPPEYAERVIAGGLSNARHLVAPGQGHGVAGVGCVPRLISEFLASPTPDALVAECLEDEVPTPFFLGFHGPDP